MLKLSRNEKQGFFIDKHHYIKFVRPKSADADRLDCYKDGERVFSIKQLKIKFK